MSWRLIFVFLLLTAGASAWGGLQLGDWLIANGPAQINQTEAVRPELAEKTSPVLDANGKPFIASAPQPLANGRQGIPELPPPTDWHVQAESLIAEHRPIALATTTITMDQAVTLAQQQLDGQNPGGLQGIGSIGNQPIQPIDVTASSTRPTVAAGAVPNDGRWQQAFQTELKACENLGFFSRPSCAWAARNKYCEPHQAWGKVDGCPAKKSSF